jgi:hypothetical protein
MKTYGGSGGIAPPFLTSALDGGEWSGSHPGRFIPGEIATGTHWMGGWVGPRAGLDAVEKRKSFARAGNRTPTIQPAVIPTELWIKLEWEARIETKSKGWTWTVTDR